VCRIERCLYGFFVSEEDFPIISYQRDHFVPTSELTFPFADDISGTIRGYRVFTACRTYRDKIFRLEDHLDRLYNSASIIHMKPPLEREQLRERLQEAVEKNRSAGLTGDLLIDIIFSGGLAGSTMRQSGRGGFLYIAVQELEPPSPEAYARGMALATHPHQRIYADVKLLNYVGAILAHQTVVPRFEADDVVFVNPSDHQTILEGSTFTVFFVNASGELLTHPLDGKILDSITRRVVLELLRPRREFTVREIPVVVNQIPSLREAFLVSTSRNVVPVTRIDAALIGNGTPGPITREIRDIFHAYLESY
jgi:branched-chain amino acid aminotransferase